MSRLGLDRFSALYLGAIFIVTFGLWTPDLFLTMSTVQSIASAQAIVAIMAIALIVPLSAGVFDLSIGAVVNLSAVIVAIQQERNGWGMWESIALAVAVSVLVGVVNAFIVVKLRVGSFIATLGTGTVIGAVQVIVSNQTQPLPPTTPGWAELTQTEVGGFQVIIVYLLVIALFFWWLLGHTPLGRRLYAIGGNPDAARLSGVKVENHIWFSLIVSSALCGVAGVLYCSLSGPSLTFGAALLLPAFAAAFLGSTQLKPGRFNIWGTVIAVYVLAIGIQGLQYVTGVQWLGDMFNGVSLIVAVGFASLSPRIRARRMQRAAVEERLKAAENEPAANLVSR
ncbi:ABC transporter permease [Amycolatopsis sp. FDAARGOS 1241]|uniref:ABC transporter permease n=1 Tax=Amycolatopsis sp. FDAARGOS 1241 TaxID=2778070 RepID=UPI00194EAD7F|nr:ABC transporter permease [Amycolatopsis sp. FDAARGOS 1241]QRP42859.1 ABC transporter permease [Amycolatopsis sp. FDAARGOS 1241]